MEITLDMSAISKPFEEQLLKYNLEIKNSGKYDKIKFSIEMLYFHNYLTQKQMLQKEKNYLMK